MNHADELGKTPLVQAIWVDNAEAIAELRRLGADVNKADKDGKTPLFHACWRPENTQIMAELTKLHTDVVGLRSQGARVDHTDDLGRTPLFLASSKGNVQAIDELVRLGARVNHDDHDGTTAILAAALAGETEAIVRLVHHGAVVNHVSYNGETALSVAGDNDAIVQTLIGLGATRNINNGSPFVSEEFVSADTQSKARMLQSSLSIKQYLVDIVTSQTTLGERNPYNISLDTYSDDGKMGMFFRYGSRTVVSIHFDDSGRPRVNHLEGTALICTGDGRVIYTKRLPDGSSRVHEIGINLRGTENKLCHELSTAFEKNWGCFGRTSPGNYMIVYSVIPLQIFLVRNHTDCRRLRSLEPNTYAFHPDWPDGHRVKEEYPNLNAIERLFVDQRDARGTGIFRGGTRGIKFGSGEFLFVGHVTLTRDGSCFPNWFMARNTMGQSSRRMYFMYFFTIGRTNGIFKISRMSSCFQPPSETFHKIVFPCGIAHRGNDIVVSFGRDDSDCLITSYPEAEVNTMLAPVTYWNDSNYVFHTNYAASRRRATVGIPPERTLLQRIRPSGKKSMVGTSPESDGRFNPAITNLDGAAGTKFVTAWRKLNGSIRTWTGYNQAAIESCSLKLDGVKLVYTRESEIVQFQAGTTTAGGEDPRLIMENDCPLLMINDRDANNKRRMYVHNLNTDESTMTTHPFCHNITPADIERENNWGPFISVNGELHFVYTVDPLVIGKVNGGFTCPSSTPTNIACIKYPVVATPGNLVGIFRANGLVIRGGTPGLRLSPNEYLFVGHSVQSDRTCFPDHIVQRFVSASNKPQWQKEYANLYMAFFYTIGTENGQWKLKRLSCCSQFSGKRENFSKIHFPSGLAKANLGGEFEDSFVVSFGESDEFGGFCAVNRNFVEYVLRPVEEWTCTTMWWTLITFKTLQELILDKL